jgi:hypothetical protein
MLRLIGTGTLSYSGRSLMQRVVRNRRQFDNNGNFRLLRVATPLQVRIF